ncbi:HEAT repeat domain-containing protein [Streptomyces sp. NBC_00825]|uniref:HEAT repeat domain-containing protein n=1 Tax=unclassified Streptomyces TaxID=2593676 RepID=UPI002ECFB161|nr:HEAT repeat domain-containing protein [Streptomyces sp. NBC_00826]WTH93703.1 HEAT repeat domain-containing protein [Streptomyces sp. NBC_00825]WTI02437.1 HEAT repeat domain-containing protein [Streptomyces sp. NBC_00822]
MQTPADEQFHDASGRAGAALPGGLPDARDRTPETLRQLIGHEDPGQRQLGLVLLTERVAERPPSDDLEPAELARLLPRSLTGLPEADLLLAGLYEELGHHLGDRPRPAWRTAERELPVRVRIAWLRADLLHDPAVVLRDQGELLYQAVRETSITAAHRPAQLVDELADSGDPVLQAEAVRLARQGLHAGLLAPTLVREDLIGLLGADSAPVVAGALGELAEPWAATDPLSPGLLAPFLAAGPAREPGGAREKGAVRDPAEGAAWAREKGAVRDPAEGAAREPGGETAEGSVVREWPAVVDAALAAAARHGHRDLLRQVVDDPGLPPGPRRRGMELLGDLADRDDIGELTAVAARDPLLFGGPAVTCLRGLHRRGHFPDDPDVPAVIGLALSDHSIPPRDVATVLFTSRKETLRVLTEAPADDPGWPRRLALLVALAGQGAGELPIGDAIAHLLPSAPAPGPFLDAIRELRHENAEEAVIALLPTAPAAALDTLEAIGGDRTVQALREGLGLTTDETAPHLRPVRNRALELLWLLNRDPALRHELLVRLDPVDLPPRIAAGLGGPDERELALLRSHLDPDEPVAALCRLAAHGTAGTLPVIADLLLRIVAEQAASGEPGAPGRTGEYGQPAGEPVVPQEVLDAVSALGRRLHERGAIRPVCLLGAENARDAGNALLATMALDLLDRPGLLDGEQAILLELLLRAPWTGTRARVHRLLRHRDRHVRKHVIALLARDATGEDAQALSATLIALTAAPDIQTVRQALLALGHARAHWASSAIAACLDHPNMNIRKTAAEALVRAGTPAALPKLLFRLGHDENLALRDRISEALHAVLGDAYAATIVAAAEHSRDDSTRELLLKRLHGTLSARSVLALHDQESPAAVTLLSLVASRRVGLASGTVRDLASALARHGITVPAAEQPSSAAEELDRDIRALVVRGWNQAVALRLAERDGQLRHDQSEQLRPMLADWLRLAGSRPGPGGGAVRNKVVRFALRICAEPRDDAELTAFARFAPVLLDALADARDEDRHDLIAVLEAVAPLLTATGRPAAVAAVRALRPAPATPSRSTLTLLRRLGAVPVRADLDRALAGARLAADLWQAETAVLREAFAVPETAAAVPVPTGTRAWRAALDEAVRTPGALKEFRSRDDGAVPSRDRLTALIEVHRRADPRVRAGLLDWMTLIQPIDAPPWTIAETAHAPAPPPRRVRVDDLDQPRSAALRERLLAMLGSAAADRRETAALALARWPEPEARLPVLRAYLRGRVDLRGGTGLARALGALDETELRGDDIRRDRVARAAARLDPWELERLVPLLLEWWEHAPPAVAPAVADALRAYPADALAGALSDRLDAGAWGFLDLLVGRPLLCTPILTRTCRRLRTEGRDELADRLLLVEGPLRGPDAGRQDAAALAALRDRGTAVPAGTRQRPTRRELLDLAATGAPEQICRALTELAGAHTGPEPDEDPQLLDLLGELLRHPRSKVRLRAHRASRTMLGRPTHLRHTELLLDDPIPDVVRMAIRTLCRAGWGPALPAVTGLLGHPHPVVHETAADGLVELGGPAVPALRRAAAHARPDRRTLYTDVLDRIRAGEDQALSAEPGPG